ncbi:DUF2267 domain-containing protein [Streptomyces sp. HSG2]|uniref:DUF2267 domain-containing protein n=1 Tax=Streptomyces sp. HSG2 TaxID=2797167 RepID=UPI0019079290|nr:DUF2267 domain-containing protein [Streptomyces sp. HSG2]
MISDADTPLRHRQPPSGSYDAAYRQFLEKVRYEGAYPTREKAEDVVRRVLAGLGRGLTGPERDDLVASLPVEAARLLTSQAPDPRPLTGAAFVADLAARTGASLATTRWDIGSVLSVVAAHAGPGPITRILARLPAGWSLLFGRAELASSR